MLENRERNRIILICAVVLLSVATIVAFAVSGKSGTKSTKKGKTTVSTSVTTTKPTTTEPTTVDSRGSTDSVKKLVALCFDDGPGTASTEKLVKGLKARGAKATFFELGEKIAENPEMAKLIVDSGSEIGIHGYTHTDFVKLGVGGMEKEIKDTQALISKYTSQSSTTHVRPPYGSYNNEIQKKIMDMGYDIILWNVDTLDWKTKDSDAVCSSIVSNGADGGDILCIHDIYTTSADGALKAVDELMSKGYKFVTISELEAARDKFVAGRIWMSGHEFYDYGSKDNVAKQSLTQIATSVDSNGNTVTVQSSKQDSTDVEITWPSDATKPTGN